MVARGGALLLRMGKVPFFSLASRIACTCTSSARPLRSSRFFFFWCPPAPGISFPLPSPLRQQENTLCLPPPSAQSIPKTTTTTTTTTTSNTESPSSSPAAARCISIVPPPHRVPPGQLGRAAGQPPQRLTCTRSYPPSPADARPSFLWCAGFVSARADTGRRDEAGQCVLIGDVSSEVWGF
ncbi:hypothetical protein VTJ49DRAFT_2164 [Mycothermus thermophilus]|uniref:Uncharacterized protein n=1 Tax=Humicola insolens TaxID=85995 RepID=A0ABR3VBT6_HUMIN